MGSLLRTEQTSSASERFPSSDSLRLRPIRHPSPQTPPIFFIYNFSKRRKSDVRRKKRKKRTKTISENTQETFKTLKRKPKCLHKTPLGSQKTSKKTPKRSQLFPKCRTTRRESEEDKRRSCSEQQEENQKKTLSLLGARSSTLKRPARRSASRHLPAFNRARLDTLPPRPPYLFIYFFF